MPSYLLGFLEQCFLHLGHFFGLVSKANKPPPHPLKYLETRRRIFFRVSLYKLICKETWYRAPNISTVTKYQKTVRNLSAMVLTISLQRPVHTIRCNFYHTILLYYYVETNKIIHASFKVVPWLLPL